MVIEHNATFIIMHVPLEFQVEVSNSYLCHHRLASLFRKSLETSPSNFLTGSSEPDASGLALSILLPLDD